ncbi:MAG: hypothetical protein ACR2PX_13125 [Endozoicomonas sp.]|uniref:hypothetical protein n=1 Tax=Endozoicomonas sp. TaxID=1892382 RepID=UPI003D9BFBBA
MKSVIKSNVTDFFSDSNRSMMGGWTIDRISDGAEESASKTNNNVAEFFNEENRSMMGGWTIDRISGDAEESKE